jgi:HEAT repeat protein
MIKIFRISVLIFFASISIYHSTYANTSIADSLLLDSLRLDSLNAALDSNTSVDDTDFVIPAESFTQTPPPVQKIKIDKPIGVWNYILSGFNNSDPIIRFCYWFVLICMIVFVGIGMFIIANRNVVSFYKKRKKQVFQDLQDLLSEYIYLEDDEFSLKRKSEIKTELIQINLTSNYYSRLLRTELLDIHKQFKGDVSSSLRQLYIELNFHKKAIKKLRYDNWTVRSAMIRELAQMEIVEAAPKIKFSLNHINPTLRLEAGIALLKLDKENPFALLEVDKELTQWQKINLLEAIITSTNLEIPSFKKWLSSKQPTVVIFALIMIEYYQQLDAEDEIIALLDHTNEEILKQAIKVLGSLESFMSEAKLIQIFYNTESYYTKQNIIEAISKIGSEDSLEFLLSLLSTNNRDIALQSAYAIKGLGQKGLKILNEKLESLSADLLEYKVIKHSLDEYLSLR